MENFSPGSSPAEAMQQGSESGVGILDQGTLDINVIEHVEMEGEVVDDEEEIIFCRVCTDRATGNHYNVYTCEGCKGFFKRTVQKQLVYHCRGVGAQGMCIITKASRNNCQFCRFNKCLAMGMLVDAVREDRAPGGKPRQKKAKLSTEEESSSLQSDSTKMSTSSSVSATGMKSEPILRGESIELQTILQGLVDSKPNLIPGPDTDVHGPPIPQVCGMPGMPPGMGPPGMGPPGMGPPGMGPPGMGPPGMGPPGMGPPGMGPPGMPPMDAGPPSPNSMTSMQMMKYGYMELRMIIQWAKKVPGFKTVNMVDQMNLLKACFMDLNVLRVSYRSLDLAGTNQIRFGQDLVLSVDDASMLGWSMELLTYTVEYINQLQSLQIDSVEFAVISALVLTYPDAKGIEDNKAVTELQSKILECLRYHITTSYPSQTKRYIKILQRLPILREISAKAKESFLRMNMDGMLQMDKLAGEMLDYDEQR